jgi:hypothetical protein
VVVFSVADLFLSDCFSCWPEKQDVNKIGNTVNQSHEILPVFLKQEGMPCMRSVF